MNSKKVIAIGELLIDFIPKQKGVKLKEVIEFERVAGGAPANVACAVGRLGGNAGMISQVGKDAFGEHIKDILLKCNVETKYVFTTDKANTALAFVSLDENGNRDFSFYRNPSADLFLNEDMINEEMFQECSILHFGSVDLVDYPIKKAHRKAIEIAKDNNIIISFDPNVRLPLWSSPEECKKAILEFLPDADIIKVSDDELEFITGMDNIEIAKNFFFERGCRILLFTKGKKGSEVFTANGHHISAKCIDVKVVDTTGAGDSFTGAFLYNLNQNNVTKANLCNIDLETLNKSIEFANYYSTYTVTKKGATVSMATQKELGSFIKEIRGE